MSDTAAAPRSSKSQSVSATSMGLLRWVVAAVVVAVICALVAFLVSEFAISKAYTATVTLQIQPGVTPGHSQTDPAYGVTLAQTYAALAQERAVTHPAYLSATNVFDPAGQAHVVADQVPSTSCTATALTALFSCSVTAKSARYAADAANAVAQSFISTQKASPAGSTWAVTVANPALLPTGPSSPHVALNTLIAFILVFLIVLGYGWLETRYPGWRSRLI